MKKTILLTALISAILLLPQTLMADLRIGEIRGNITNLSTYQIEDIRIDLFLSCRFEKGRCEDPGKRVTVKIDPNPIADRSYQFVIPETFHDYDRSFKEELYRVYVDIYHKDMDQIPYTKLWEFEDRPLWSFFGTNLVTVESGKNLTDVLRNLLREITIINFKQSEVRFVHPDGSSAVPYMANLVEGRRFIDLSLDSKSFSEWYYDSRENKVNTSNHNFLQMYSLFFSADNLPSYPGAVEIEKLVLPNKFAVFTGNRLESGPFAMEADFDLSGYRDKTIQAVVDPNNFDNNYPESFRTIVIEK